MNIDRTPYSCVACLAVATVITGAVIGRSVNIFYLARTRAVPTIPRCGEPCLPPLTVGLATIFVCHTASATLNTTRDVCVISHPAALTYGPECDRGLQGAPPEWDHHSMVVSSRRDAR